MTEQDLLKYSKATLARYIVSRGTLIFYKKDIKGDLDRIRREFELAAINKELDLNAKERKALVGKGDYKSRSQYYALLVRDDKLLDRLTELSRIN